jgi:hypothetical protein
MELVIALLAFVAGIVCGLALRPSFDRRRKLHSVYKIVRQRQRSAAPFVAEEDPGFAVPRDYYTADRKERGTLSENFGLKRRAGDRAQEKATAGDPDPSQLEILLPRDYYERETPDDEGLLSEGYGLRRKSTPPDAA